MATRGPGTPTRWSPRDASAVLGALSQLSERHQEVIALRFLADLTTAETAEALGITRAHVAVLSHRALGALRAAIGGSRVAAAGRRPMTKRGRLRDELRRLGNAPVPVLDPTRAQQLERRVLSERVASPASSSSSMPDRSIHSGRAGVDQPSSPSPRPVCSPSW